MAVRVRGRGGGALQLSAGAGLAAASDLVARAPGTWGLTLGLCRVAREHLRAHLPVQLFAHTRGGDGGGNMQTKQKQPPFI